MPYIPGTKIKFDSVIGRKAEECRIGLGLSRPDFVRLLGYENVGSGCRKYQAFLDGRVDHQFIVENLSRVCEETNDVVQSWLSETKGNMKKATAAEEQKQFEIYIRRFRPYGVIETECRIPSPIFVAAFSGSPSWKLVKFDFEADTSFVQQVRDIIPSRLGPQGDILAFGKPTGIIINLTPFYARRYDLDGLFLEELDQAFRVGTATMGNGKYQVNMAKVMDRVLTKS